MRRRPLQWSLSWLVAAGLAACVQEPVRGPEADATAALDRGDQRVLHLVAVEPEGKTVWIPIGARCFPPGVAPYRRVGEDLSQHEKLLPYVRTYNRALVSDRRYRYKRYCGPQ